MISISLLVVSILFKYDSLNKSLKEAVNYLIVGVLTTVVSIISYNIFRFFISDYLICTILSWIVSVLFAYITNRKYVFKSKNKNIKKEFIAFTGSRVLTLILDMVIMFIFVTYLQGNDKTFKLVSQVLITTGNYVISKLLIFKK